MGGSWNKRQGVVLKHSRGVERTRQPHVHGCMKISKICERKRKLAKMRQVKCAIFAFCKGRIVRGSYTRATVTLGAFEERDWGARRPQ